MVVIRGALKADQDSVFQIDKTAITVTRPFDVFNLIVDSFHGSVGQGTEKGILDRFYVLLERIQSGSYFIRVCLFFGVLQGCLEVAKPSVGQCPFQPAHNSVSFVQARTDTQ